MLELPPHLSPGILMQLIWVWSGHLDLSNPQVTQGATKIENHGSKRIIRIQFFMNQMTH